MLNFSAQVWKRKTLIHSHTHIKACNCSLEVSFSCFGHRFMQHIGCSHFPFLYPSSCIGMHGLHAALIVAHTGCAFYSWTLSVVHWYLS
uniref:Uncharacterized protein n=1 Tax=Rhizophora mucronata TaxID=61149 RepID=A0A2P2Q3V0_RHIMU